MSVIETLVTVFKADTDDLVKGAKQVDDKVDAAAHSMESAEEASANLGDSFTVMAGKAFAAVGGIVALTNVMRGVISTGQDSIELEMLSQRVNSSMKEISTWGHAIVETGGKVEDFYASIDTLGSGIQELAITGDSGIAQAMRHLGLNFLDASGKAKPLTKNLEAIASRIRAIPNEQQALHIGEALGLDQATILLMRKGEAELGDILKQKAKLAALDAENAKSTKRFNVALSETGSRFRRLFMSMGNFLFPAIEKVFGAFNKLFDFLAEHKPFLFGLLAGLTAALVGVAAAAWAAISPFLIMGAKILLIAAAISAVVTAIALLADDIYNFVEGNDSLIGRLLGKWEDFKYTLGEILGGIGESIKIYISEWLEFFKPLKDAFDFTSNLGEKAGNLLRRISGNEEEQNKDLPAESIVNLTEKAKNFLIGADTSPVNSISNNTAIAGNNTRNVTNNINANATINTQASDPGAISNMVGGQLGDQMRSAIGDVDDGVLA